MKTNALCGQSFAVHKFVIAYHIDGPKPCFKIRINRVVLLF